MDGLNGCSGGGSLEDSSPHFKIVSVVSIREAFAVIQLFSITFADMKFAVPALSASMLL